MTCTFLMKIGVLHYLWFDALETRKIKFIERISSQIKNYTQIFKFDFKILKLSYDGVHRDEG